MKQTRARSPEKKAKQFKKIKEEGRRLFLKVGSEGFSMRALARKLNMSPGNLYNYVQSKRELWFATIREDFEDFTRGMGKITENYEGSQIDLLLEIANFYFDFASEDIERYKMMFMTPAPISNSIGPIETNYEPKSFEILVSVVTKAIELREIRNVDPMLFTLFIWGIVHGNVELRVPEAFLPKQFIADMGDLSHQKEFIMEQLRKILDVYKN